MPNPKFKKREYVKFLNSTGTFEDQRGIILDIDCFVTGNRYKIKTLNDDIITLPEHSLIPFNKMDSFFKNCYITLLKNK